VSEVVVRCDLTGLEIPRVSLEQGIPWGWETFAQYLDVLAAMPRTLDVGTQLTHGALRAYVMGDRGARNEPASSDDIARMAAMAASIPGARHVVLEGAGHLSNLEQPEAFNAAVRRFLAKLANSA